jgi:choline dehydrogenase-like flavoprotein
VFRLATVLREKHGPAELPDYLTIQDWGVTYEELEPLYWRAEQMMGVGGKAGNLRGHKIEGAPLHWSPKQIDFLARDGYRMSAGRATGCGEPRACRFRASGRAGALRRHGRARKPRAKRTRSGTISCSIIAPTVSSSSA